MYFEEIFDLKIFVFLVDFYKIELMKFEQLMFLKMFRIICKYYILSVYISTIEKYNTSF